MINQLFTTVKVSVPIINVQRELDDDLICRCKVFISGTCCNYCCYSENDTIPKWLKMRKNLGRQDGSFCDIINIKNYSQWMCGWRHYIMNDAVLFKITQCRSHTISWNIIKVTYRCDSTYNIGSYNFTSRSWMSSEVKPFSAGTVFIRQNLTSVDARFWRIKTVPALKELTYL